jgi:hypothetical protein
MTKPVDLSVAVVSVEVPMVRGDRDAAIEIRRGWKKNYE